MTAILYCNGAVTDNPALARTYPTVAEAFDRAAGYGITAHPLLLWDGAWAVEFRLRAGVALLEARQ